MKRKLTFFFTLLFSGLYCCLTAQNKLDTCELFFKPPNVFYEHILTRGNSRINALVEIENTSKKPVHCPELGAYVPVECLTFPDHLYKLHYIQPGASAYFEINYKVPFGEGNAIWTACTKKGFLKILYFERSNRFVSADTFNSVEKCGVFGGTTKLNGKFKEAGIIPIDTVIHNLDSSTFSNSFYTQIIDRYYFVHDTVVDKSVLVQVGKGMDKVNPKKIIFQQEKFMYSNQNQADSSKKYAMILKVTNTSNTFLYLDHRKYVENSLNVDYYGRFSFLKTGYGVIAPNRTLFLMISVTNKDMENNTFILDPSRIFANTKSKNIKITLTEGYEIK